MNANAKPHSGNGQVDLTDTQALSRLEKKLDDTHVSMKDRLGEFQSGVYERRNGRCQSPTTESSAG